MFGRSASRFSSIVLCVAAFSSPSWANQTYQVAVPTVEPYTRFENHVAPGSFTDRFEFSLDSATNGYLWLFARQDAWFGFNLVENTQLVTLTLRNVSTQDTWTGSLYPQQHGQVSWLTPGVMSMVASGFDPNKSLYLSGTFGAGQYVATISGLATGSSGSSYIAKFSLPQPVPEPETWALMLLGGGLLAMVVRRQRRSAA